MKRLITILISVLLLLSVSGPAGAEMKGSGVISGYYLGFNPDGEDGSYLLEIEEYGGKVYAVNLDYNAVLRIDSIPAVIDDFKPGMEVYAKLAEGKLNYLEGYSTVNTGYIEPGSKMRKGTISSIKSNRLFVTLNTGEKTIYQISPITLVSRQGKMVGPDTIYAGDRVKFYFDSLNTDMISRMELEGDSVLVNNIYKGELSKYDSVRENIVLSSLSVFRDGKWKKDNAMMQIPLSSDIPVLYQGYEVPLYQLDKYRGSTVYSLTCNKMGTNRVERMLMDRRGEAVVTGQIEDINWYTQSFELSNNMNFKFDDNTVIIRSGRLQDTGALEAGLDVSIIGSGYGWDNARSASMVQVLNENVNNSSLGQHYIFAGRLDQVHPDSIHLRNYYVLDENIWDDCRGEKDLYYYNDIGIYDTAEQEFISVQEFVAGDYSVDETSDRVKDRDLKDYYAYVYTDGEEALAVSLLPEEDSMKKQRISTGIVSSVTYDELEGWNMTLSDARDWSAHREQWMMKDTSIRVNLDEAIIIKNNACIEPEELKTGERLYLARDDFNGRVLLVK